ncbi:hypothetical protein GCM10010502_62020 [Kitasatospora aureofaciens]|uniref:Uncharacterized protein n=1 Tax=Kitasatospora aureofaciens TaxID=1894 RepID=A0A8H9HXM4_KITAU|nr:hypothetical protein GCM10010502_62020 [Kitasatospora aureofaciens]
MTEFLLSAGSECAGSLAATALVALSIQAVKAFRRKAASGMNTPGTDPIGPPAHPEHSCSSDKDHAE